MNKNIFFIPKNMKLETTCFRELYLTEEVIEK